MPPPRFERPPPPVAGFIVYDVATGVIKRIGVCQPGMELAQAGAGEAVILSAFPFDTPQETHKVDLASGELVPLEAMALTVDKTTIAADGIDTATISGVPAGALLWINDVLNGPIADGLVAFSAEDPGTYRLQLTMPGYLSTETVVTAVEPPLIVGGAAAVTGEEVQIL